MEIKWRIKQKNVKEKAMHTNLLIRSSDELF